MPIADLILDSSPSDIESFYFKATDRGSNLTVQVASKNQFKRLVDSAGGAPGLYILQAEDSTVYVGKSVDLSARLKTHKSNNKIGYRRILVMQRDQTLAHYLDYGEARLYETLRELGYRLDQSPLSSSLEVKQQRLTSIDREHVVMADGLIRQFLVYSVALGLHKPMAVACATAAQLVTAPSEQLALPAQEPLAPTLPPVVKEPPPTPEVLVGGSSRAGAQSLWVKRRDGTELRGKTGVAVLVAALTEAGLAQVAKVGLTIAGGTLVSRTPSEKYPSAAHPVGDWFVLSHSNTAEKARKLRQVSLALGLDWQVFVE